MGAAGAGGSSKSTAIAWHYCDEDIKWQKRKETVLVDHGARRHRNAAAEDLAARHSGFYFLSRPTLLKQGFNPGHGEHAAIDGAGKTWFVLLDDCLMGSDRIKRSWTRRHVPNQKYWPDPTGRKMCEVAQEFLVVSTFEANAERHRARILKDCLPADVLTLKALWKS